MCACVWQRQGVIPGSGGSQQQQQQARTQEMSAQTTAQRFFARFDVITTSYHLVTSRFDLHLCDDTESNPSQLNNIVFKKNVTAYDSLDPVNKTSFS
jgi:hypothetical protein